MNHTADNPTGTKTVRLADIPETIRIREARKLMNEATTIDEFLRYLELAYMPGDAGGRITT